jgi:hypothetical protein
MRKALHDVQSLAGGYVPISLLLDLREDPGLDQGSTCNHAGAHALVGEVGVPITVGLHVAVANQLKNRSGSVI